ncbi:MAG: PilZ domain-containing protein [Candidatus Aquicultor sp.]|nr:PilZ domain-containing protein [Candidatus Aquicultor sp.]
METVENNPQLDNTPSAKDLLLETANFSFQLQENENPLYFQVVMSLDDKTFVCRAANKSKITRYVTKKEVTILCPVRNGVCSMRARITRQTLDGDYIAITPIAKPAVMQQRRSFRLRTSEDIGYRIQFDSRGNIYKGAAIEDISDGGLGVLVHAAGEIESGTKVKITIELNKHDEPIVVLGEVANCKKHNKFARAYRVGIRFTHVKEQDLHNIVAFIKNREDARGEHARTDDVTPIRKNSA